MLKLQWDFTAESYLDQLSSLERAKVLHTVAHLPAGWDSLDGNRLAKLEGDQTGLFSLRVGSDLRVLVRRQGDVITVVDVVRKGQVDGLRRAAQQHHAALE